MQHTHTQSIHFFSDFMQVCYMNSYKSLQVPTSMDLHILSLSEAVGFQPTKTTYGIRIYASNSQERYDLQESQLYTGTHIYVFDDNERLMRAGPVDITEEIADLLIRDFATQKDRTEALMVHCSRGKNRAPAVAIALNEVFDLGHDTLKLKAKHNGYNKLVYKFILRAGQRHNGAQ